MDRKEGKKFLKKINFKNKISAAKEKFLEKLNVPDELAHNLTKITMIENNYIKIQSKNIYIVLDGSNLNINEINDSELLISGNISNIGYLNR